MYGGQAMVHTSGLLGADALAGAMAAGTQVGSFHPLVAFADLERAVAALHGATIAIEGDDQLLDLLARMAEALGGDAGPPRARARSPPTTRPRSSPRAASTPSSTRSPSSGRLAGLDEAGSLAVYGPLIEQTLGNARALGIDRGADRSGDPRRPGHDRAPTSPSSRPGRPDVAALYARLADREIGIAERRGALTPEAAADLRSAARSGPCNAGLKRYHCQPMERSIAARYAARPAAQFVRPSARARERQLGLQRRRLVPPRVDPSDGPPSPRRRRPRPAPRRLAGDHRRDPPPRRRRPAATPRSPYRWTGSAASGATRRSSAATAPWRG